MKKFILALVAVLVATSPLQAGTCEDFASLGKEIMDARQVGVPMPKVMKIVNEMEEEAKVVKFFQAVAVAAYEQPKYSTEAMQLQAVTEFENEIYGLCIKKSTF